jgi:hypothetical protein
MLTRLVVAVLGAFALNGTLARPVSAQQETGFVKEFGSMWTFDAPPLEHWRATYGWAPDQAWLDNARMSAVRIPGCSASFVSSRGLVMTNHHCARSCITQVSPPDTNYQTTGFAAKSLGEEKPCEGMYADQLQSIKDVTSDMTAAVTSSDPAEAAQQRAAAMEGMQKACATAPDVICQVVPLFNGGRYSLYTYKRYGEVKLVMAPEEAVSFFGGDPDNFTFPRYDLDMTFVRVYQDGKPFTPQHHFTWSDSGATESELVFVIGNPGSTGRLNTLAQMQYLRDVQYPAQLAQIARQLKVLKVLIARDEASRRQYEDTYFSLENAQKAIGGYLTGLRDTTIMARKAAFERDFRARVGADAALRGRYGTAWTAIEQAEQARGALGTQVRWYGFGGSPLANMAGLLVRLPAQAALADDARLPQYRGAGLTTARNQGLAPARQFDMQLESMLLTATLTEAKAVLPANDPWLSAMLGGRTPEAAAAEMLDGTRLADPAVRQQLIEGGAEAIAASEDPLIVMARAMNPMVTARDMALAKHEAAITANAEKIGQAIYAAYGTSLPPDATFTLRISDGVVKGFPMNGTIAPYRTSFYGLFGRSAEFGNVDPFQLPERWKAREDSLDLSTPLNYVATNDIIGGNSGSPVINKAGEVVGLIFDGNIEMLPNRFIYTDEVARSVAVHSAGIVEALRKVYDAGWLADELEE